jgi:fatty-acyl-CoA synthase
MHGSGQWFAFPVLNRGGSIITVPNRRFDPVELLDTFVIERATGTGIVGDAFARPLLERLDAEPDRWDLSAMRVVLTSGAMASADVKRRLLTHLPRAVIVDGLGSSESGSFAESSVDAGGVDTVGATATFRVNERTRVIDDDGHDVVPGSGERGRLAAGGHLPLGYYKDPEKTAATFVELDGRRYVVAGDWAQVERDGTITLLGRGSNCINTGGEKVYPEEVEEILKALPMVDDALVFGVDDERFGQRVAAVVSRSPGTDATVDAVVDAARVKLAAYKVPRSLVFVDEVPRTQVGKADYPAARQLLTEG